MIFMQTYNKKFKRRYARLIFLFFNPNLPSFALLPVRLFTVCMVGFCLLSGLVDVAAGYRVCLKAGLVAAVFTSGL